MIKSVCFLAGILVLMVTPVVAIAAGECSPWAAKLASLQGHVEVKSSGSQVWGTGALDDTYCPGDTIRVGANSRAAVVLPNETLLRLDQNTVITLTAVKPEAESLLDLLSGIVNFISRVPRSLKVNTPYVNAAIEGTEFVLAVKEKQADITVFEGTVLAQNPQGELRLTSGESATAIEGQAPIKVIVVRPRDAVQWALYYPLITDPDSPGIPGDIAEAQRLLFVGRVAEAQKLIEAVRTRAPDSGDALAIASIIELAQNNKIGALDLANQAVALSKSSAAALLALSFAEQAHFDLEAARSSVEQAIKSEPNNALAWARMAELWASLGDQRQSLEAAERAVELHPNLSRTQTVLGFSYLIQLETANAKNAFLNAIELDSADPLARLGLGLAKIREGYLADGRREMEIALSLDPGNSLVRSYLGKAYFEEGRNEIAGVELVQAKVLDPLDPTPWLYDAIRKQSENRPAEALRDFEESVALNNNRAVYRSRLLLDEDSAMRSAGLGLIYSSQRMEPLAMLEAAKSLHANPTDHSAHRLLADVYSGLNVQESFKTSAFLKTLLFQPKNIRPLSPEDTANNLGLLDGLGPTSRSFHELGSLFDKDGHSILLRGELGNHDTAAYEAIVYGSSNKFSYSAGYSHRRTDGFRDNSDQKHKIGELFTQWSASPGTRVQFEYRKRDTDRGDIVMRGDVDDFFPNERNEQDTQYLRTGLVFDNSPSSTNVLSVSHHELDSRLLIEDFPVIDIQVDTKSLLLEGQNIWRGEGFRLVSGVSSLSQDTHDKFSISFGGPPEVDPSSSTAEFNDVYTYLYSDISEELGTVFGVSYDKGRDTVAGNDLRFNRFNPKFGAIWTPSSSLALTSSIIYMNVRPLLIDTGTIEPTIFGRFSAHRDTERNTGTKLRQYAIGVDHKWSTNLSLGTSAIWRRMKVPFDSGASTLTIEGQDEDLQHVYAYWRAGANLSFTADMTREAFDREIQTVSIPNRVETKKGKFGITFSKWKLSTGLFATSVNQDVRTGSETSGDDFWLIDLQVDYRFSRSNEFGCIAKNLADNSFSYVDNSFRLSQEEIVTPEFLPTRTVACRVKLAF